MMNSMNLMNLIKVMNFSGAGEAINFGVTFIRRGLERPERAAVHRVLFGRVDPLSLTCRLDGLLPDGVANDRLAAIYCMALSLGTRRGELIGLRWQDVDWPPIGGEQQQADLGRHPGQHDIRPDD
jgi:hypothetical protein